MNNFFLPPSIRCVSFFVCVLIPALAAAALRSGAGWSGAGVLFLAAAAVGGSRRDGVERSGSKPRLFKGFLVGDNHSVMIRVIMGSH